MLERVVRSVIGPRGPVTESLVALFSRSQAPRDPATVTLVTDTRPRSQHVGSWGVERRLIWRPDCHRLTLVALAEWSSRRLWKSALRRTGESAFRCAADSSDASDSVP